VLARDERISDVHPLQISMRYRGKERHADRSGLGRFYGFRQSFFFQSSVTTSCLSFRRRLKRRQWDLLRRWNRGKRESGIQRKRTRAGEVGGTMERNIKEDTCNVELNGRNIQEVEYQKEKGREKKKVVPRPWISCRAWIGCA
jgi:hypothetical protein